MQRNRINSIAFLSLGILAADALFTRFEVCDIIPQSVWWVCFIITICSLLLNTNMLQSREH